MRIAMVANAAATHTQRWSRAMAERGHTVAVFSVRPHPIAGVEVVSAIPSANNAMSKASVAIGYLTLRGTLRRKLRRFRPDVVHAHYASTNGYISALAGAHPMLLTVWGSDVVPKPGKDLSPTHRHRIARAVRHADIVTSASEFMADHVRSVADPGRLEIIPFGVDLTRFRPVTPPGTTTVLVAKSLEPRYGIEFVIDAMKRVTEAIPDATLVIAGDGSLRKELERAADVGGTRVVFRGAVPHDDLASEIVAADVVVNPTIVDESFGVVVLEAQAVGRPVVVTRVGAVSTVCIEDETALFVEPKDSSAMADAIVDALRGKRLPRAAVAGPEFVRRSFDWQRSVTDMEDLYREIAK